MSLNVVIPTYRRPELLERTLSSLSTAAIPDDLSRVIVLENGPRAGAYEVCREFETRIPIEYHHRADAGKGRAIRWIIERLGGGFVLLLDDDVRVSSNLLIDYSAGSRYHGPGHFFGGPLRIDYEEDAEPAEWLHPYLPGSAKGWSPLDPHEAVRRGSWFRGANLGVFAQDVLAAGGLTGRLGPGAGSEGTEGSPSGLEDDLQARLVANGCVPVYLEQAVVWHWVPRERCTEEWALHRAYRNAITIAIRTASVDSPLKRKVRAIYEWGRCIAAAAVTALVEHGHNRKLRFKCRYRLQHQKGLLYGYRIARTSEDDGRGRERDGIDSGGSQIAG